MRGAVHMQITTIGLDIAKNVFQVHGIDASEKVVTRKRLRRSEMLPFFEALPVALSAWRHAGRLNSHPTLSAIVYGFFSFCS